MHPLRVLNFGDGKATVDFHGRRKTVDASLIGGLMEGDYVLVHGDMAVQKLDSRVAEEMLMLLRKLSNQ